MARVYNFSAGPSMLPEKVLRQAQAELLVGKPIESSCPENMRHSQYAKQLMKQAEEETKRLYGILEQKYGKTDTYTESYAPQNSTQAEETAEN